jgi:hypothetical protein
LKKKSIDSNLTGGCKLYEESVYGCEIERGEDKWIKEEKIFMPNADML